MKVLILTGKFGMGHYSASYSIEPPYVIIHFINIQKMENKLPNLY